MATPAQGAGPSGREAPDQAPPDPAQLDAVVLAGGRARRLGGAAKPHVQLDGRGLLARVLDGLTATGLVGRVAVVGPPDVAIPSVLPLLQVQEDPPFGGPVAGLDAGLTALSALSALSTDPIPAAQRLPDPTRPPDDARDLVVVVACDVPGGAQVVPALVRALREAPHAVGACARADGRDQWLLAVYRRAALAAALGSLHTARGSLTGASVRELVADLALVRVDDASGATADVDTWADLDALRGPSPT